MTQNGFITSNKILHWSGLYLNYHTHERRKILNTVAALLMLLLSNYFYIKIPSSWAQTNGEKKVAVEIMEIEE